MDTLRIRQQQGAHRAADLFRAAVQLEGPKSLFKGMSYPLLTAALQNAVVFYTYGTAYRYLQAGAGPPAGPPADFEPPARLCHVFLAGCMAGTVQTAVVTPVDLLKIRLQLQTAVPHTPGYLGPLALLRNILATEGPRGLYRGTVITAIRDIPSHGVYFAAFQGTKRWLDPGKDDGQHSAGAVWAAGGIAGAVSWMSVYGFDVVKSRIQAHPRALSPYTGWWQCAGDMYRKEGGRVFFRGLPLTIARAFVVNGAIFSAYEASHKGLKPFVVKRTRHAAAHSAQE
jgi:solute carrier family 25 (mitochondrial carnitine/acylcarnitine transporter), member 20/29